MKWALYLPVKLPHAAARVLFYLADRAKDDGTDVFPAVDTIAERIQGDRKTVQRSLKLLCALDVLRPERTTRGGRKQTNQYRINLRAGQAKPPASETPDLFPETVAPCPGLERGRRAPKTAGNRGTMPPKQPETGAPCPKNRGTMPPDSIQTPTGNRDTPIGGALPPVRLAVDNTVPAPPPPPAGAGRGTRLPEDWQPSEALVAFAVGMHLDPVHLAANFRDYWHAVPGQRGRKADWSATWRVWCRKEAERTARHASTRKPTQHERVMAAVYGSEDPGGPVIDGEFFHAFGAVR